MAICGSPVHSAPAPGVQARRFLSMTFSYIRVPRSQPGGSLSPELTASQSGRPCTSREAGARTRARDVCAVCVHRLYIEIESSRAWRPELLTCMPGNSKESQTRYVRSDPFGTPATKMGNNARGPTTSNFARPGSLQRSPDHTDPDRPEHAEIVGGRELLQRS